MIGDKIHTAKIRERRWLVWRGARKRYVSAPELRLAGPWLAKAGFPYSTIRMLHTAAISSPKPGILIASVLPEVPLRDPTRIPRCHLCNRTPAFLLEGRIIPTWRCQPCIEEHGGDEQLDEGLD